FLKNLSILAAGMNMPLPTDAFGVNKKLRVLLVGTGVRGTSFWGRRLVEQYGDILELVAFSYTNPGRLAYAKEYMKVNCLTYVYFDESLRISKPDLAIVTTVDATHPQFIV